jgi:hypothetical protein
MIGCSNHLIFHSATVIEHCDVNISQSACLLLLMVHHWHANGEWFTPNGEWFVPCHGEWFTPNGEWFVPLACQWWMAYTIGMPVRRLVALTHWTCANGLNSKNINQWVKLHANWLIGIFYPSDVTYIHPASLSSGGISFENV